nr:MAG TPA: hypothetical protein [Caudoviricetes sp.]
MFLMYLVLIFTILIVYTIYITKSYCFCKQIINFAF